MTVFLPIKNCPLRNFEFSGEKIKVKEDDKKANHCSQRHLWNISQDIVKN